MDAALNKIIAGILAGDYNTALPVTSIESQGTVFRNAVFIPSTKIPGWKGTLRRWEVAPCGDSVAPANHVDASTIPFEQVCARLKDPNVVVTSGNTTCVNPADPDDPRNSPHFHLKWDAACSLLDQADPTKADYNRRIYTVASDCGVGDPATGPNSACASLKVLRKDAATATWIRANIRTVDWSRLDFDGDGRTADVDDDDIQMLIDFVLGGDGNGRKRAWLMGDVIGSSTQVVATPLTYALKTVPPKDAFDQQFKNRTVIAYVAANDGLLHAFRADHDPHNPASPPVELGAFLPPAAFPSVVKMFQNFRANPKIPTGQAEPPNFDQHIWTMAAPLNAADVWIRWTHSTLNTPGWRTVLYVPMGPTTLSTCTLGGRDVCTGLYALDVTDPDGFNPLNPEAAPPFRVLWYWTPPPPPAGGPSYGTKVWNAVPIGPTRAVPPPKVQGQFLSLWVVGVNTTDSADTHVNSLMTLLAADTGQTVKGDKIVVTPVNCDPSPDVNGNLNPFCVPFHVYGHMALASSEVPLAAADMPNTHTFSPDTAGRIHTMNIFPEAIGLWRDNSPSPLNLSFSLTPVPGFPSLSSPTDPTRNPIYFTPSVIHALGKKAFMMATVTGSIFETDSDVNDNANPQCCQPPGCGGIQPACFCSSDPDSFCTKIMLDIFDIDPNTRDIRQNDPSRQHFAFPVFGGPIPVTNGQTCRENTDCSPDFPTCQNGLCVKTTVNLSTLTRPTTRPLIVVRSSAPGTGPTAGTAYFLVMDPSQFIPELGVCAGVTYLIAVDFSFTTSASGTSVQFASTPTPSIPIQQLGFGPVTSITAIAGKLVVVQAGYGSQIAVPKIPGPPAPNQSLTLPLMRGVRRVQ